MEGYGQNVGQNYYTNTAAGYALATPTNYAIGMPAPTVTAAESESASRIRDGISQAEQLLSGLHEAIAILEKRLDTVLTAVPPQPASTAPLSNKQSPGSHLAGRVGILNEGFDHAIARLRDLARRIEV